MTSSDDLRKVLIFVSLLILTFFTACTNNKCDCSECCQSNYPTPYNTHVVCDNQYIWDNRGSISGFKCDMPKRDFPATRICTGGLWVQVNSSFEYKPFTIHCSEVIGIDRRCD